MSIRWLAGAVLFGSGFVCALVLQIPAANATAKTAATSGVIEGGLKYVDGEDFRLVYAPGGKAEYLVTTARKAGATRNAEPLISARSGLAVFSKKDLQSLTVYRVTPLILWRSEDRQAAKRIVPGVVRCGNAPYWCPLPPPPDPPDILRYTLFKAPTGRIN